MTRHVSSALRSIPSVFLPAAPVARRDRQLLAYRPYKGLCLEIHMWLDYVSLVIISTRIRAILSRRVLSCYILYDRSSASRWWDGITTVALYPRNYWAICWISEPRIESRSTSARRERSLDVAESLYRFPAAGIDARTWSRIVMCGNTYDQRRILWHARQTGSQQPGASEAGAAVAGYTPPLGYVIYRSVKGSVKISVAATRMRVVSAVSCICSLSRLENGSWSLLSDVRTVDANLTTKSYAIPPRKRNTARTND